MNESFNGSLAAEVLVIAFCSLGLIFNLLVITSCELVTLTSAAEEEQETASNYHGSLGLFQLQEPSSGPTKNDDETSCRSISSIEQLEKSYSSSEYAWTPKDDMVLTFAQVGSALSFVVGLILFGSIIVRRYCCCCCWKSVPNIYQLILYICGTGVQVCLGWVYSIWFSNGCSSSANDDDGALYQCSFGSGTIYLILAEVSWLFACLLTSCMRPSREERIRESSSTSSGAAGVTTTMADDITITAAGGGDEEPSPTSKRREKFWNEKTRNELMPVGVVILIIALLLYFALRNVNNEE